MKKSKKQNIKDFTKFKMNLIGENNKVRLTGSTPGKILSLICAIFYIFILISLIISMFSG
jgi:hypothetical protein